MTDTRPRLKFDDATAISKGARDYQEDALIADFTNGAEVSVAVLADGMGGHAAGDLASKIVVTEVFNTLMFRNSELADEGAELSEILRDAAETANNCLNYHVQLHPQTKGMGATLVSCVIRRDELHWISIGDSPLYLFRDNALTQLNEDHSLGPHIDMLVRSGNLTEAEGLNHPERNALTSVLLGQKIAQIDCPAQPFRLVAGDVIILASDGLQFLKNEEIAQVLRDRPFARSSDLADALMARVEGLGDPDLDNVTIALVKVQAGEQSAQGAPLDASASAQANSIVWWPFKKNRCDEDPAKALNETPGTRAGGSLD